MITSFRWDWAARMRPTIGRRYVRGVIAPRRGKTCAKLQRLNVNVAFTRRVVRARRGPVRRGPGSANPISSINRASVVSMVRWLRDASAQNVLLVWARSRSAIGTARHDRAPRRWRTCRGAAGARWRGLRFDCAWIRRGMGQGDWGGRVIASLAGPRPAARRVAGVQ